MVNLNFTILAGGYSNLIHQFSFTSSNSPLGSGSLSHVKSFPGGNNPSWIGLNRQNASVMCATQEVPDGGAVTYVIDRSRGEQDLSLNVISNQSVNGDGPAFCDFTKDNTLALYPVYGGKELTLLEASDGGAVLSNPSTVSFSNNSNPHQAVETEDEILVPDLGADRIWRLKQIGQGAVIKGWIAHPPHSGPRHIIVKDNCLVTLHELNNHITTQQIPGINETSTPFITDEIITPPGSDLTKFAAAEVILIPESDEFKGDVIFVSNRQKTGPFSQDGDEIVSYRFYSDFCSLLPLHRNPTGLTNLRGMAADPTGHFIVTASAVSGGLQVFARNGSLGQILVPVAANKDVDTATSFVWFQDL